MTAGLKQHGQQHDQQRGRNGAPAVDHPCQRIDIRHASVKRRCNEW
jgi:hypothetical protein